MKPEYFLFLPQMRLSMDDLVTRARHAESVGFHGIALMDHLAPPMAEDQPMYEALTTATWIAAHTTSLRIGHLVLCDSLRSPAVLAKQAVTLDHASNGRFELGLGSGSMPTELRSFGIGVLDRPARLRRLGEALTIISALWTGDVVDFSGEFFTLRDARQLPRPLNEISLLIGGASPPVLDLVRQHATWWNLPVPELARLNELLPLVGPVRPSVQQMLAYVSTESDRGRVTGLAERRFGQFPGGGPPVLGAEQARQHFTDLHAAGVERFYVWFTDFAAPETLDAFGTDVIAATS